MAAHLDRILRMTASERRRRSARDIDYVTLRDPPAWTRQVLRDLRRAARTTGEFTDLEQSEPELRAHSLSVGRRFRSLPAKSVLTAYRRSRRRVLVFDYGGTLSVRENMSLQDKRDFLGVSRRKVQPAMLHALRKLADDPANVAVCVVSGTRRKTLQRALGSVKGLCLAAASGRFITVARSVEEEKKE